jgi:quercetin dioxygenase-like cupin family protein
MHPRRTHDRRARRNAAERQARVVRRLIPLSASLLLLASCAADAPDATTGDGAPAVRTPLLTNATKTILGQPITYPSDSEAHVSSAIVVLQPGQETGWHRHDTPLYVHVLDGTVTVSYDGDIVKAYSTGETFIEAIGTYHNGQNLSTEPVHLLTVSIGAEGYADTEARP